MDKAAFVQKVKMLCLMKGVKPTSACKESGVGTSFLNDIERGRIPSVERVQMLAAYLGVTTSELLGEEKGPTPVSEDEPLYPPEYDMLSPTQKEIVDRLIIDLVKTRSLGQPPIQILAAAADGGRTVTEADPDITLPDSSVEVLPEKYKGEIGCVPPAPEEK